MTHPRHTSDREHERPIRARVARSIFWIAWSRGLIQVAGFVTTVMIARILAPADYGVMALATIFTSSAGALAEMGLGAAIIQFRDLGRREIDTCFWITTALATATFGILALSASTLARWFAVPRLADVLPAVALVLPVSAASVVSDSLLRKRLALDRVSQAEIIGSLVTLPVMAGCALAGLGLWTLVVGSLVGPVTRSIATCAFAPWRPGIRIGGERVREMIHFSLATLGIKGLWLLREMADELVVGKAAGQVTLGLYSMARQIALLPASKTSGVVNMLTAPLMAELQADLDAMRTAFYRTLRLTAAIAVPTAVGMALVADQIVATLLGPKWLPAIPILRLLCFYSAVRAVDVVLPPVLVARRREHFLFRYCLTLVIVVPAAAVVGALWNGVSGIVVAWTVAYCTLMTIMANRALTELKGGWLELWSQTWPILGATAVMSTVVLLLREFGLSGSPDALWMRLVILAVSGAVAYGVALVAIGSPVIGDGIEVAGWILGRDAARVDRATEHVARIAG
jgi:O-antigen/teichoic acid export membrane protein